MIAPLRPRPWYLIDSLVDDYVHVLAEGGDLRMLKTVKILRSVVVNVGIIAITLFALLQGADATVVGSIGLGVLAAYNGIEIADYQALARAVVEASQHDVENDED